MAGVGGGRDWIARDAGTVLWMQGQSIFLLWREIYNILVIIIMGVWTLHIRNIAGVEQTHELKAHCWIMLPHSEPWATASLGCAEICGMNKGRCYYFRIPNFVRAKRIPPWKKEDPHQVRFAQSQWWWAGSWSLGRGEVARLLHRAHQGTRCFQKLVRWGQCPWLLVFWGFVSCGKLGPVIRLRSCWKQRG